jgi:thiopurine S-methyltransferase
VALPEAMRARYAGHLAAITGTARQLLISFDYDQAVMDGPPFSVPEASIRALHGPRYAITPLAAEPVEGGLKGKAEAMEEAWRLVPL